jgi:hypothetical protein
MTTNSDQPGEGNPVTETMSWKPDDVAAITYGTDRTGGRVVAVRAHDHKGWVFAGRGNEAVFVYDSDVRSVEPLSAPTPQKRSCPSCGVTILASDLETHRKWHEHLERMFDISVGIGVGRRARRREARRARS